MVWDLCRIWGPKVGNSGRGFWTSSPMPDGVRRSIGFPMRFGSFLALAYPGQKSISSAPTSKPPIFRHRERMASPANTSRASYTFNSGSPATPHQLQSFATVHDTLLPYLVQSKLCVEEQEHYSAEQDLSLGWGRIKVWEMLG